MKRALIIVFIVFASVGMINAQLLWRISSADGGNSSYLFGTHHTAPLAMLDSVAGFYDALAEVDAVVGEMDMTKIDEQSNAFAMMKFAKAPADSTLSKVTSAGQRDSIASFITKHIGAAVKFEHFEMFKPALLSTTIAQIITQKAFPENDATGIDIFVQKKAAEEGKQIAGFETIEFQFEMLFGSPISEQIEDLMTVVRDEEKAIAQALQMGETYLAQDIEALYKMIIDPEDGMDAEEAERMIYSRNRRWIPQIEKQIAEAPTLIVVGAGHLPGEQGLIQLLRQSGYAVEAVK